MYYVYLFKNKKLDTTYIGYTNDLKQRLALHNDGKVQSTRLNQQKKLSFLSALL